MPQFDMGYDDQDVNIPLPKYGVTGALVDTGYRHAVVDSRQHDVSTLLTAITGASYNVDYYAQVLNENDELRPFDPLQSAPFQQYQRIDNYELKLQESISQSFNPTDNRLTATGSALTYPYLIPNVGDAFISDIGNGRAGLFTVTEALKKTRFKQTTYEISFELAYIVTEDIARTIDECVVERYHFVKDYIMYGKDPVLTSERFESAKTLKQHVQEILSEYLSEFYSYRFSTLLVPSNHQGVYDPFVIKTMLTLFDSTDHPLLSKITQLNTDDAQFDKYFNIWQMLLLRQANLVDNCFSQIQVIPARSFSRNALLQTVAFSGIDLIVLPITRIKSVDDHLGIHSRLSYSGISLDKPASIRVPTSPEGVEHPSIPSVEDSSQYMFTQSFYERIGPHNSLSDFENLVKRYLNQEHLDYKELIAFSESRNHWSTFERFYLLPVLLLLMIYQKRSH